MDPQALKQVPRRSRSRTVVAILILVVAWTTVMSFRWQIRTRWWAYRLTRAETRQERDYYLTCLCDVGNRSLGALGRIVRDPRPEIRRLAVTVLENCTGDAAEERLYQLLVDEDADVGVRAAGELVLRRDTKEIVQALQGSLCGPAGPRASSAAAALRRVGGPEAEKVLLSALSHATDADLKAQVIDSLGLLACERAAPLLIEALADHRPVTQLPYSRRSALRAPAATREQLASEGLDPRAARAALEGELTVASVAAQSLAWIAGESPGDLSTRPADGGEAIRRRWETWWRQQRQRERDAETTAEHEAASKTAP